MAQSVEQMKITPLPVEEREDWRSLAKWQAAYSEAQLVEMLHRYMDAQLLAKGYRQRAALKAKALKETMMNLALKAGFDSVEEYMEAMK